jgi:hypothetical protein
MKMARLLRSKAVSQLLWSDKDREEWFSLGENHEKASRSVYTNCETALGFSPRR